MHTNQQLPQDQDFSNFINVFRSENLSFYHGDQHLQHPKKHKTQKLRNNIKGNLKAQTGQKTEKSSC